MSVLVLTEFTVFMTNVSKQFQIVKWAVSFTPRPFQVAADSNS